MRVSVSNLAWDVTEDSQVASLLKEFSIDAIDIAPGKYFPVLADASESEILSVKNVWLDRNIEIIGMQSLLFGTHGLNVFGEHEIRNRLLAHMKEVCRIGSILGATRLVFGSPKNRDCSGLSARETEDISRTFFRALGDIAADYGVIVCLEPNPTIYGANFMTSSHETYHVVQEIAHPAIKMQLDTGAIIINQEDILTTIAHISNLVGHIHISEANLVPPGDTFNNHAFIAQCLKNLMPNAPVTIEMLATKDESHILSIRRALLHVTSLYC